MSRLSCRWCTYTYMYHARRTSEGKSFRIWNDNAFGHYLLAVSAQRLKCTDFVAPIPVLPFTYCSSLLRSSCLLLRPHYKDWLIDWLTPKLLCWPLNINGSTAERIKQEAQLPQRNSASATHVFLGWLTGHVQFTQHRRWCTTYNTIQYIENLHSAAIQKCPGALTILKYIKPK